jgi:hypothetical protein
LLTWNIDFFYLFFIAIFFLLTHIKRKHQKNLFIIFSSLTDFAYVLTPPAMWK